MSTHFELYARLVNQDGTFIQPTVTARGDIAFSVPVSDASKLQWLMTSEHGAVNISLPKIAKLADRARAAEKKKQSDSTINQAFVAASERNDPEPANREEDVKPTAAAGAAVDHKSKPPIKLVAKKKTVIVVDDDCHESDPCQHYVSVNGVTKLMDGPEIYKLLRANDVPVNDHFAEYAE
jgi:hypothetical protein